VHTRLDLACTTPPSDDPTPWGFAAAGRMWVDASYRWKLGEPSPGGYCAQAITDPPWPATWYSDSVENLAGASYSTFGRMEMIVGSMLENNKDTQLPIRNHACAFYNKTPVPKKYWIISTMAHKIQEWPDGLDKLLNAIWNQSGTPPPGACPPPSSPG
jgi:hypothetical protein